MSDLDIEEFAKSHPVGFCKVPDFVTTLPSLTASRQFMAPSRVDLRDFCTKSEDQGSNPWCAAYAAAQFAENIRWRVNDYPEDVNPAPIYRYAKTVDGNPTGEGTTLTAVLTAIMTPESMVQVFSPTACSVKVLRPNRLSFKYAIHKFGCCLAGFNISSQWWGIRKDAPVIGTDGAQGQGGHAVLCCGYDKQGLWIQNSWGVNWGEYGFAKILWEEFDRECMYGAVLENCLNGLRMN